MVPLDFDDSLFKQFADGYEGGRTTNDGDNASGGDLYGGNDADMAVHQSIDFIFEFVGDDIETSRDGNNRLEKRSILVTKNVQTEGNDGSGTNEFY